MRCFIVLKWEEAVLEGECCLSNNSLYKLNGRAAFQAITKHLDGATKPSPPHQKATECRLNVFSFATFMQMTSSSDGSHCGKWRIKKMLVKLKFWNRESHSPDGFRNDKLATMWNGSDVPSIHANMARGRAQEARDKNLSRKSLCLFTRKYHFEERYTMGNKKSSV